MGLATTKHTSFREDFNERNKNILRIRKSEASFMTQLNALADFLKRAFATTEHTRILNKNTKINETHGKSPEEAK